LVVSRFEWGIGGSDTVQQSGFVRWDFSGGKLPKKQIWIMTPQVKIAGGMNTSKQKDG
jgi:hypothetical protein